MTDRPILFSAPMVRAILDGSKTQTRRVVKPVRGFESCDICRPDFMADPDKVWWHGTETERVGVAQSCPYGQPGDRLWVRENFSCLGYFEGNNHDEEACANIKYADGVCRISDLLIDTENGVDQLKQAKRACVKKTVPSIHMPRWASRITLEITDVRVERLHDISRGDAMEEGCPFHNMASGDDPRRWFSYLWQSINGSDSWDANPWVWVISFKRVEDGKEKE